MVDDKEGVGIKLEKRLNENGVKGALQCPVTLGGVARGQHLEKQAVVGIGNKFICRSAQICTDLFFL